LPVQKWILSIYTFSTGNLATGQRAQPFSNTMKILVCVKQVPESETVIHIKEDGSWIDMDGFDEFKMNRLDEFAVEEAIRLKETLPDVCIDVISVGPDRSADVIKRSIGMGADNGVHIVHENEVHLSPASIAAWIAQYAKHHDYTLILTGAMSEDCMNGQTGPMIAAHLGLPYATGVIYEKVASDEKMIYVEREIEGGKRDTLELNLPAVLTIQSGNNIPRYPVLSKLLKANKQELEIIESNSQLQPETGEDILQVDYPQKSRAGAVLEGSQQDKARELLRILRDKALLE
jgi:electron transfer flavoprotein beta subunit